MAAEKFHADSRQTHEEANKRFFAILRTHLKQQLYLANDHRTGKSVADTLILSHMGVPLYTPLHVCVCVRTLTAIERRISTTFLLHTCLSFRYRKLGGHQKTN